MIGYVTDSLLTEFRILLDDVSLAALVNFGMVRLSHLLELYAGL